MSARGEKLAASIDALTEAVGALVIESRAQRMQLNKISAALGLEIEDREIGHRQHGLKLVEHEREINRLKNAQSAE